MKMTTKISAGNSKLGNIPNLSLAPGRTCSAEACRTCYVGGDFASRDYAAMWARVAAANPGTNFLAFTKQWDMVRGIDFPANFSLVLSAWPGTEIPADLTAKYSTAWVDDGTTQIPANAMECPGNCDTCGACWGLARMGIDVKFRKH